ncbi:MAG: L,D-transpeptidase family protein [Rhodospirillaceae bacterium]
MRLPHPPFPLIRAGVIAALAGSVILSPGASATPTAAPPPAVHPSDQTVAPTHPRWVAGHSLSTAGAALIEALERADEHGLTPADYGLDHIRAAMGRSDMAAVQDLLDKAFLRYAGDLIGGRGYTPTTPRSLLGAVAWSPAPQAFLHALPPALQDYQRLKDALADLRGVVAHGDWPYVADGPTLRDGATGPTVAVLRERLGVEPGEVFDDALREAVKQFQIRHGLAADGVVGPATRAALNVSAVARARQVAVNLERLRRSPPLPDSTGLRVEVNVAAYELAVRRDGGTVLRMKVAVGRPDHATPEMRHEISSVVFNPHWYVPRSIAVKELLPREKRDPGMLEREGFEVIVEGDPPRLRQKPGPNNALGRVKFSFPNSESIYLHDTNAPQVFQASQRAVSHGCVRVENPFDLAALLLEATGTAPPETVAERVEAGLPRAVKLKHPVPIDIAYRTAWVEPDGILHLRPDVYGLDATMAAALDRPRRPLVDIPVVALD